MKSTRITAEKVNDVATQPQVEAEVEHEAPAKHEDAEALRRRRAQIAAYI
jgi:hypothetical protein